MTNAMRIIITEQTLRVAEWSTFREAKAYSTIPMDEKLEEELKEIGVIHIKTLTCIKDKLLMGDLMEYKALQRACEEEGIDIIDFTK